MEAGRIAFEVLFFLLQEAPCVRFHDCWRKLVVARFLHSSQGPKGLNCVLPINGSLSPSLMTPPSGAWRPPTEACKLCVAFLQKQPSHSLGSRVSGGGWRVAGCGFRVRAGRVSWRQGSGRRFASGNPKRACCQRSAFLMLFIGLGGVLCMPRRALIRTRVFFFLGGCNKTRKPKDPILRWGIVIVLLVS